MNETPEQSFTTLLKIIENEVKNLDTIPDRDKEMYRAKLDLLLDDFITKCKEIKILELDAMEPESGTIALTNGQKIELQNLIKDINPEIKKFVTYFVKKYESEKATNTIKNNWLEFLFILVKHNKDLFTTNPYWNTLPSINEIKKLVNLNEKPILEEYIEHISENLQYDNINYQWKIHFSFFNQITKRLTNIDDKIRATRMYIVHENLHFDYHKFSSNTVSGKGNDMGNFPNCVEEADYQADVYAILTELAYQQLSPDATMKDKSMKQQILHIIKVAIETTFSFIPGEILPLKSTQIRRVNRTFNWGFIYYLIYSITETDEKIFFNKLMNILVKKPIIELWGPSIFSKNYRTFYKFKDLKESIWIGAFYKNEIHRFNLPKESTEKMLDGIRNANFDSIIEGMKRYAEFLKITGD